MKSFTMGNGPIGTNVKNKNKFLIAVIAMLFALALSIITFAGVHGIKVSAADGIKTEADYPNFVIKNNIDNTTTRTGLKLKRDANALIVMVSVVKYEIWVPQDAFTFSSEYTLRCVVSEFGTWNVGDSLKDGKIYFTFSDSSGFKDAKDYFTTAENHWGYVEFRYDYTPAEHPLPEEPTKEGYHFTGWFRGTEEECDGNCTQYTGQTVTEDINLHAHFAVNKYTVTFNTMGGASVSNVEVDYGASVTPPTTTLQGHNFLGWFKEDGTQYNGEAINGNIILTARWQIQTFTVNFYADGELYKTITVNYGTKLVDAMSQAEIASYMAMTTNGVRLSKMSIITENAEVLVQELTGKEKFGDFVSRNMWVVWTVVGVIAVLGITAGIAIAIAVKRR